jgi:hypothetical protein
MLLPDDDDYHLVSNTIRDDIADAKTLASTTAPAPPPGQVPLSPAQNASMAKALVDAINNINLGKVPESKSDAESNKEINDALIKYQLFSQSEMQSLTPARAAKRLPSSPIPRYPKNSRRFFGPRNCKTKRQPCRTSWRRI